MSSSSPSSASPAAEYVSDREIAALTGISRVWLQKARLDREGPPYYKIGKPGSSRGRCLYRVTEVLAWLDTHRVVAPASPEAH